MSGRERKTISVEKVILEMHHLTNTQKGKEVKAKNIIVNKMKKSFLLFFLLLFFIETTVTNNPIEQIEERHKVWKVGYDHFHLSISLSKKILLLQMVISVLLYFNHCVLGLIFRWLTSRTRGKKVLVTYWSTRQVFLLTNLCFIDARVTLK